ncbi:MAG: phospholipase D-like domain-containing protein [Salinivirgaceae bacterium]
MDSVHEIAAYFVSQAGEPNKLALNEELIFKLNHLNRAGKGDLKILLFNEAKKLSVKLSATEVVYWLENCYMSIEKYAFRYHQVFFSPGSDIPEAMMELIKNAEHTIDLCIFTITHQELAKELELAFHRGIQMRILTDDEKQYDAGSCINDLRKLGIPLRTDKSRYHMHNKFGVIDSRMIFTGSFNWTYTAVKHNQENLLVTTNFDIVAQYRTEFERLWNEMKAAN